MDRDGRRERSEGRRVSWIEGMQSRAVALYSGLLNPGGLRTEDRETLLMPVNRKPAQAKFLQERNESPQSD